MSITSIKIDRVFGNSELSSDLQGVRVAAAVALAVSILVPIPGTPVTTSGEVRQYFLENAASLQPALDDIREVTLFNNDTLLANAFAAWNARYQLIHCITGELAVFGGSIYTDSVRNVLPKEIEFNKLKLTGELVNEVAALIRQILGLANSTGA